MFHVLLLEQDIIKKRQEFLMQEFETGNDKVYQIEAIGDIAVYAKKADKYLSELYYFIA